MFIVYTYLITCQTSSSILNISPLVGEECLDHLRDGQAELEADVFLEGIMESMSDIFLDPLPPLILSWLTFLATSLPSLSLPSSPSSISSSASTSCLEMKRENFVTSFRVIAFINRITFLHILSSKKAWKV